MKNLLACALLLLLLAVGAVAGEPHAVPGKSLAVAAAEYHGNRNSYIFHRPGCRYYNCKNCVVYFATRQAALKAGFRPCKVCKP
jgi:hypothetical protein